MVSRETLGEEVERLTGDAEAAKRILGVQPVFQSETHLPRLSGEAAQKVDAMILEILERMAEEQTRETNADDNCAPFFAT